MTGGEMRIGVWRRIRLLFSGRIHIACLTTVRYGDEGIEKDDYDIVGTVLRPWQRCPELSEVVREHTLVVTGGVN